MTFLAPLFLLGSLAIALPVLLHLRRRRAKQPQPFPSLMFLDSVPVRSVKRRRLRDVGLLAARCAALLLLALTFAQPTISSLSEAGDRAAGEQVLILLDRSYSMSHGERWNRALEEARTRFAVEGDDVALIAFASDAEVLVSWQQAGEPVTAGRSAAVLDGLDPEPRVTEYASAVRAARRLFNTAAEDRPKRAVLITDAQASGWDRAELGSLPAEVEFELIDVRGEAEPVNLAVLTADLDRQRTGERERVVVSARVARFAHRAPDTEQALDFTLELRVDGREVETVRGSLPPGEDLAEVEFQPFTVESQTRHRGLVRLQSIDGSIPVDDEYRFVLAPGDALTVLVLEAGGRGRDRGTEEDFYLARALRTLSEPRIRVETTSVSALSRELVDRADVAVLLDGLPELDSAASELLAEFVRDGGGVLVTLGSRSARALQRGSLSEGGLLTPPLAEGAANDSRSVRRLASFVSDHPAFAAFGESQQLGSLFGSVAFFRTLELQDGEEASALAFLDNGVPLLVERRFGRGLVHWFGSTLDNSWTDLPLHAAYVPWLDGEMRALAGYRPLAVAYEVETVADLRLGNEANDWVLERPDGSRSELAELIASQTSNRGPDASLPEGAQSSEEPDSRSSADLDEVLLRLESPGFWEVSSEDLDSQVTLASNVSARESDDTAFDLDEFIAAVSSASVLPEEQEQTVVGLMEQDAPRGRMWWAIAAAALLALCVEGVLAAGRKRRGQAVATG